MRRVALLALVAGGAAAAVGVSAFARQRVPGGLFGFPKPDRGIFPNGMAYVRWGTGPRTALWIVGGPGVGFPWGLRIATLPFVLRPFADAGFTCWLVDRKRGMPEGYSVADMAEDYATLIADELGGRVDLVLGEDYGGAIAYYLAARHPDRLACLANASSGYAVTEQGRAIDREIGTLIAKGRPADAFAGAIRTLAPDLRVPGVARIGGAVMGWLMVDRSRPDFTSNLMVETEAEAFDAREVLPDITVPVLLIGGDRGPFFTREILEETARLIPDCTLRIYEGRSDPGAVSDRRLARDVLDFVDERSRVGPVRPEAPASDEVEASVIEEPTAPAEQADARVAELVGAGQG